MCGTFGGREQTLGNSYTLSAPIPAKLGLMALQQITPTLAGRAGQHQLHSGQTQFKALQSVGWELPSYLAVLLSFPGLGVSSLGRCDCRKCILMQERQEDMEASSSTKFHRIRFISEKPTTCSRVSKWCSVLPWSRAPEDGTSISTGSSDQWLRKAPLHVPGHRLSPQAPLQTPKQQCTLWLCSPVLFQTNDTA